MSDVVLDVDVLLMCLVIWYFCTEQDVLHVTILQRQLQCVVPKDGGMDLDSYAVCSFIVNKHVLNM